MRLVAVPASAVVTLAFATVARAQMAPPAPERIAVGDWQLAPVFEARVRGEYRHDLDGQDGGILTERVRLGADVQRGPFEARIVLQDARLWDLAASNNEFIGQPAALAVTSAYEAWGEAHTSGARPSFLRVGRQPVTWGEGRLLGVADWSPTGRALDAVRGRVVTGNWAFELLGAALSDPVPSGGGVVPSSYGELVGARAEWSLDPLFATELYVLVRFAQSNPAASLESTVQGETYTGALRLHGAGHGWTWGAEGAGQAGRVDTLSENRAAWATAGHIAYLFEHTLLRPALRVTTSYASGDHGGSTYGGFDPLLPDVHTWHGMMDVFSWSNEEEASVRAAIVPFTDTTASVEYRYARLARTAGAWHSAYLETIAPSTVHSSAELGHEIDAVLRWSPWAGIDLRAEYSVLALGDGAKELLSNEGAHAPPLAHVALGMVGFSY